MNPSSENASPSPDEVRAALGRLRAFADFSHSPRLVSFLEFIVGEALEGRGDSLRAYTVAVSVFERDANFDAHNNSIVRVEATRLRKAIRNYYEGDGRDDPVRIEVPLGGYVPKFVRNAPAPVARPPAEPTRAADPEPAVFAVAAAAPPPAARQTRRSVALAGAGLALVAVAFGLGTRFVEPGASRFALTEPATKAEPQRAASILPLVNVSAIQVDAEDVDAWSVAGQLQQELADAIARFDEVGVLRGFARSNGDLPPPAVADYELQGHVDLLENRRVEATFRLLHAVDRRVVWSGAFNLPSVSIDAGERAGLVRSVATPIAQPFGAIASDLRARIDTGAPTSRSAECIARFEDFWDVRTEATRRAAHECLTAAVAAQPRAVAYLVRLASLNIAEYLGDLPRLDSRPPLDAAEDFARMAIRIAPQRAHPYLALSQALNLRGDYENALHLAEHARELNPFDTEIMAQLGAIYIVRGKPDAGARLLRQAMEGNPAYPGWINFYLFLEAFMRDDPVAQRAAIGNIGESQEPDAIFARVIAAAESGEIDEARRLLGELRDNAPSFAASPRKGLERLTLAPGVIDRMMFSMKKAGL